MTTQQNTSPREPTVADLHRINANLQQQHNHDMRVLYRQDQELQSLRARTQSAERRLVIAERKAERLERENSRLRQYTKTTIVAPMLESGGSSDRFMFGAIVGTAITSVVALIVIATGGVVL